MGIGNQFAATIDRDRPIESEAGGRGTVLVDTAENHTRSAGSDERFLLFLAETDQVHEAGLEAFAQAAGIASAKLEAAASSDGGGVIRESLGSVYLLIGGLLGCTVPLVIGHLLLVMLLAGGGEASLRAFVGSRRLRTDQSLGPILIENIVHLVLAVQALECGRFGRSMRLRIILRHLIGG